ncbi:MAG: hypothetical protein OEM04_04160 [Flavobacteriaceae bacterium]|nr:hypothetical protein [Flavobacteriaceae bacterium]
MITKNKNLSNDKKVNPLIGFILFIISISLLILTGPIGFIYGLIHGLFTRYSSGIGAYFLELAISIDQLGNVIMQHLLNLLWIRKTGYKFGNRDETISSVIGKNLKDGTLTSFGMLLSKILDAIDPNHSLDSIDYHIEPKTRLTESSVI